MQFKTPSAEALRLSGERGQYTPRADQGASFEDQALVAHEVFRQQLDGLAAPPSRDQSFEILSELHWLINGTIMRLPSGMVPQVASLPEVFSVTPHIIPDIPDIPDNPDMLDVLGVPDTPTNIDIPDNIVNPLNAAFLHEKPPSSGFFHNDGMMRNTRMLLNIDYIHNDLGITGNGVTVVSIDGGIYEGHPEFARYLVGGRIPGWQFYDEPGTAINHGTQTAGAIISMAPEVKLWSLQRVSSGGPGLSSLTALQHATRDIGADVIYTWGWYPNTPYSPEAAAVSIAVEAGHVVVAAVHNQARPNNQVDAQHWSDSLFQGKIENNIVWQSVMSPLSPLSINVAAGTYGSEGYPLDMDDITSYSGRGPVPQTYHIKPDIVTNGYRGYTTWDMNSPGNANNDLYGSFSGTSQAGPLAAGIAALLVQAFPSAPPHEIKARLMNNGRHITGVDMGNSGQYISVFSEGAGFVQPLDAILNDTIVTVSQEVPMTTNINAPWEQKEIPSFNYGSLQSLLPGNAKMFCATISNRSNATITYNIDHSFINNPGNAAGITFSQRSITVAPGRQEKFYATISVSGSVPGGITAFYEGFVNISGGSCPVRLPFALVNPSATYVNAANLSFDLNGGAVTLNTHDLITEIDPIKIPVGANILGFLKNYHGGLSQHGPFRDGHIFMGWYMDPGFSEPVTVLTNIASNADAVLHARWGLDVANISVFVQPAKLSYYVGEPLDLNGLVIRVLYSDGSSDIVPHMDFGAYGLASGLSDGTVMSIEQHNNSTIKIMHALSGKSTRTHSLAVMPLPIESAMISIEPPLTGSIPAATVQSFGAGYTVSEAVWAPALPGTKFLGSTIYTVAIKLSADNGYAFSDALAATVNGHSAGVASIGADTAYVEYTFGPTAEKTVADVIILSQPHALSYTEGEALDLAGLEAKLIYNDDTTENVVYAGFVVHGLSAEPADGTILSITPHNGMFIAITHESSRQATLMNPLTVITAPPTFEGLSIKTQPLLNYIVGDTLDLTSLVITIGYSDLSFIDVGFQSFWEHGYITSIDHGTVLEEAHNGARVSITHAESGRTANTSPLTVDTAQVTVVGISIKTQPMLIYAEGGALDLSALVVAIRYSDSTTKDVAFSGFAENDLTTDATHGAVLGAAHNGTRITVAHGASGLTARTNMLAISPASTAPTVPTAPPPPPAGGVTGSANAGGLTAPIFTTPPMPSTAPTLAPTPTPAATLMPAATPTPRSARTTAVILDPSSPPLAPAAPIMDDIDGSHWAAGYIGFLAARGIVSGYPAGGGKLEFRPDNDITRAELMKLICVSLELELIDDYEGSAFADWAEVPDWARPFVAALVEAGIVKGSLHYNNIYIYANNNVTREEMVTMIVRALGAAFPESGAADAAPPQNASVGAPDLGEASFWARDFVVFALQYGMINVDAYGNINPIRNAKRDETAMALYMLLS
ncbi:MAG: S8 family serine peptidase [Oscillospiraceae bacterium]|nr:S8 family serine peptidase [Oscillospiraceae bacterium]